MNGIRRALVLATAARYFSLVANFVTLAIVSRLLTPKEIGVSVLGMAICMLALSVREFATTNFIIQRADLKQEDVRATFTLLMLVTAAISLTIVASSNTLAEFYSEPGLVPYLQVLSLYIMMEVIGAPISALLRRGMAFGKLAVVSVIGATLLTGLTITFVLMGFSYMSFAWAALVSEGVVTCIWLVIWPDKSIFIPSMRAARDVINFGGYNGANVLLFKIYDSLPYIVLGRILTIDTVALYNRGATICQLPDKVLLGGAASVLLSAFSAEVRNGRSLRDPYLHSVELITSLLWPAVILLAILADPIVRFLLGDQWLATVPIVRIMAIASLFSFSAELNYPVLIAVGAMRDILMRSAIVWPVSGVIITCAAFFGLKAAALSWLVTLPFQAYISVYFVRRHVDIDWHDIAAAIRKSSLLVLISAAGPLAVIGLTGGDFALSYSATAAAVLLSVMGWALGVWLTAHPILQEIKRGASDWNQFLYRIKNSIDQKSTCAIPINLTSEHRKNVRR